MQQRKLIYVLAAIGIAAALLFFIWGYVATDTDLKRDPPQPSQVGRD